jgi:competence protein ComFC
MQTYSMQAYSMQAYSMQLYVQWHYTPFIRQMLHRAKFTPTRRMFSFLGKQMDSTFRFLHPHLFDTEATNMLLVPMPPSERHLRERLFNQALVISKELSFGTVADLLVRDSSSAPQSSLGEKLRKENMRAALSVKSSFCKRLHGRHVIVVDDIVGSGASMTTARNVLLSYGAASVRGVAVAISPLFAR